MRGRHLRLTWALDLGRIGTKGRVRVKVRLWLAPQLADALQDLPEAKDVVLVVVEKFLLDPSAACPVPMALVLTFVQGGDSPSL